MDITIHQKKLKIPKCIYRNIQKIGVSCAIGVSINILGLVIPGMASNILLSDDFNNNVLDPQKWKTNLNIPQGGASVTVANQRVELVNRGYLITRQEFDPLIVGPLKITGQWTFASSPFEDFLQIITRSDAIPNEPFGEVKNGVEFNATSKTPQTSGIGEMTIGFRGNADGINVKVLLPIFVGDVFDFEIIDDGLNLSFTLTEVGGDGTTGRLQSTSTSNLPTDFIVFHNRERVAGDYIAYLDDVTIESIMVPETTSIQGILAFSTLMIISILREAIKSGDLKAKIIGKSWRIKRFDLENYIDSL